MAASLSTFRGLSRSTERKSPKMSSGIFNDGVHIKKLMDLVECKRHKAPQGIPCFHMPKNTGFGFYAGICNKRAVSAGANGRISQSSYQQRTFTKKR